MKKTVCLLLGTLSLLTISSCGPSKGSINENLIKDEIEKTYNYFMATTNLNENSNGYGLVQDRFTNKNSSSIAATGFALAAYPIYVEEGLMTKEEANEIVTKSLETILRIQNDERVSYEGCISHFVNMNTGLRVGGSEISTIDTAILVSGAIASGAYFEGEAKTLANTIWSNVDYNAFSIERNGKKYISMGTDNPASYETIKQLGPWDYYAEQLMIYILGVGNPNEEHRISKEYYEDITKNTGEFEGHSHIYSWYGSIFTYQFSHAFYDFHTYEDSEGINWHENSVEATLTSKAYSEYYAKAYRTFEEGGWGLTACDTPTGYSGLLGTPPRGWNDVGSNYLDIEGTVAPCGAIGSFIFTPQESYEALELFRSYEALNHPDFGLYDSYNLDYRGIEWYCRDFVGIDKGISVLMMGNYLHDNLIQELVMSNPYVIEGFTNNGFSKVSE